MRKLFTLLLITSFASALFAQNPKYVRGLAVKKLFLDFQSQQEGGSITAFKNYRHGFEIGITNRISDKVYLYIPGKFGVVQDSIDKTDKTILGADAVLQYMFYNEKSNFVPYVMAGVGVMQVFKGDHDMMVPLGAGIHFKVSDRAYVNWQSEYRISLNLKKNVLHHGLGIVYMFGGAKDKGGEVVKFKDSDKDGVRDDIDLCPQVKGLPELNGCPDTDGDGIPDYRDACPDMKGSKELKGCPDSDGDGVSDNEDECPNVQGSKLNKGCPEKEKFMDKDHDGVEDKDDRCPDQAGSASAQGCPDVDGDGVPDFVDKCPTMAGKASNNGCPDKDGDGVSDNEDNCPDKPGLKIYNGCPDTDGDGMDDFNDKCPTMAGPVENNGCPKISREDKKILDVAMRAVQFDLGKSTLKAVSYKILNQVANILQRYPDYNLVISGHTDNTGSASKNQKLSTARAKACYEYLLAQGIDQSRMSYVGYGESRPIANNNTLRGRALNRRVEFNLVPAK